MSEHINIQDADGVRRITIDRPAKRNAVTREMLQAIGDAVAEADLLDHVRAILLDSTGTLFCAGADLDALGEPAGEGTDPGHHMLVSMATASKPLVAAVQGHAVGIGVTMLLHFDLIYAAPGATFRTPFVDLGLTPEGGSSFLLPQRMGGPRAAPLLLLGEAITADQALAGGLISEVTPLDRVAERALAAARALAAKPPQALARTKVLMRQVDLLSGMETEQAAFAESRRSAESHAAVAAMRARIKGPATS